MTSIFFFKDGKADFIQGTTTVGFYSRGENELSSECGIDAWRFIAKEQGGASGQKIPMGKLEG